VRHAGAESGLLIGPPSMVRVKQPRYVRPSKRIQGKNLRRILVLLRSEVVLRFPGSDPGHSAAAVSPLVEVEDEDEKGRLGTQR
ncbi:MAG: hypothetical protein AB1347_12965, partial [Acidobacteriota bacterium]